VTTTTKTISPLQASTMEAEIVELKKYARQVREQLKRTTAKDIYASLIAGHRRKLIDLAISLRVQPVDALLFQRALPRPAWVPRASWDLDKDFDLVAWVELEDDNLVRAMSVDPKVQNWRELVREVENGDRG